MNFRTDYDWSQVENPITDEQVKAWVEALRSKTYEQGRYCLSMDGTYCCLGVANSIFDLGVDNLEADLHYWTESEDKEEEAVVIYMLIPHLLQEHLAEFNDIDELTFAQIADKIEKGFGLA